MRKLTNGEFRQVLKRLKPWMKKDIERLTKNRCWYLEASDQVVVADDDGDNECSLFIFYIDEGMFDKKEIVRPLLLPDKPNAIEELVQALVELGDEMIWFCHKLVPRYSND